MTLIDLHLRCLRCGEEWEQKVPPVHYGDETNIRELQLTTCDECYDLWNMRVERCRGEKVEALVY